MDEKASKYLTAETASSAVCNAILNYASAWALFHTRTHVPVAGKGGLFQDSIGETFFVTWLSTLVPLLIARHRRRAGVLPVRRDVPSVPAGSPYWRSLAVGLLFALAFAACNYFLLPHLFPEGASLRDVLWYKTVYGTVLGAIATFLILHRALREADAPGSERKETLFQGPSQ